MSGQSDPERKSKTSSSEEEKEKDKDTELVETNTDQQGQHGVRRKLRTLTFGRRRKTLKDSSKKRKSSWAFKFPSRARQHLPGNTEAGEGTSAETNNGCNSCVCTVYRRTEDPSASGEETTVDRSSQSSPVGQDPANQQPIVDLLKFNPEDYPVEDWDERARQQRAKEIEEGVDPPPGFKPSRSEASGGGEIPLTETLALCLQSRLLLVVPPSPYLERFSNEAARLSRDVLAKLREIHFQVTKESLSFPSPTIHTQVDYIHCLVPDLLEITNCSFYWGKMDRYEAEKLLENKPEGTFLLRDSAQEEYLFSVSFQRYGRSLHARIEQWNHKFSFDSHDPGVFASNTVCGLIEHYKDPSCCMYFEPMLTIPLHRTFPFSLQHLCRSVICSNIIYDGINTLQLPRTLKSYLKEYHYRQRVRVRRFDMDA